MTVRRINPNEAEEAARLEKECLFFPWSKNEIISFIASPHSFYYAAFEDGVMVGILSASVGAGECSIDNVAVHPSCRRRGVGSELIKELFCAARNEDCRSAYLEVAEDNVGAIALYGRFGFTSVGRRPHFYGKTDALLMKSEEI